VRLIIREYRGLNDFFDFCFACSLVEMLLWQLDLRILMYAWRQYLRPLIIDQRPGRAGSFCGAEKGELYIRYISRLLKVPKINIFSRKHEASVPFMELT
jgi:hypothetical protein